MANFKPEISVVICTYNRDKFIGQGLQSFVAQTLAPSRYELIIVNNNCSDNTDSICQNFIKENPQININYVIEGQQGLSFARNRGITEAKSPIITYVDDDAILSSNFIETILDFMQSKLQPDGCGGKVIPKYEIAEPKWMSSYLEGLVTKVDYGEQQGKFPPNRYPAGCNMTYRKDLLEKVGGFDEKLKWRADDKYIYLQIATLTKEIYYLPQAYVHHIIDSKRTSFPSFKKICIRTGNEERIRVKALSSTTFLKKVVEYIIKFFGSMVLALPYLFKFQFSKSKYLVLYRWYALKGLVSKHIE